MYLGEISLPCCMKAPNVNQRLFFTEKWLVNLWALLSEAAMVGASSVLHSAAPKRLGRNKKTNTKKENNGHPRRSLDYFRFMFLFLFFDFPSLSRGWGWGGGGVSSFPRPTTASSIGSGANVLLSSVPTLPFVCGIVKGRRVLAPLPMRQAVVGRANLGWSVEFGSNPPPRILVRRHTNRFVVTG